MSNEPYLLRPSAKDYLWGGTRLNDDFNLNVDINPFAEAWVCSTYPNDESLVDDGLCKNLRELLVEHPEYLGSHPLVLTQGKAELPILIKLIDAKKNLSVQVHPDDDYALRVEHERGKTEMWYVLDAKPDSKLVYGFNREVEASLVRQSAQNGSIEKLLQYVPVHRNDLFYIKSGTVHAIGEGMLIAEIQESSDVTYRLYDYGRVDKNGKKRALHIDKALEVLNFKSSSSPRQPMRVLKYRNGCAYELLARCKYFQVERMLLNTEVYRSLVSYRTDSNSFHALLCVDGCGSITSEKSMINFFKGDCIFVPADSAMLKFHGRAQILDISC